MSSRRTTLTFIQMLLLVTQIILIRFSTNGFSNINNNRVIMHRSRKLISVAAKRTVMKCSTSTQQGNNDIARDDDNIPPIVCTQKLKLNSGIEAEVMTAVPKASSSLTNKACPPLVFIHGSFHASWCWAEFYLPYFASLGYHTYALSLRGTGGTYAGDGVTKVKMSDHVNDIHAFLDHVMNTTATTTNNDANNKQQRPPVVISHSFGGLAIMKLLEKYHHSCTIQDKLSGIVMLCSVPPSGNGKMTMRFLRRSLRDSWSIISGFVMKSCITDTANCRKLFFGSKIISNHGNNDDYDDDDMGISDQDLKRYQSNFAKDSVATIDLADLSNKLPSNNTTMDGVATFVMAQSLPPVLVVGASDDFIVDQIGVEETATYFHVKPLFIRSPHDVMLGRYWRNGADAINHWLVHHDLV